MTELQDGFLPTARKTRKVNEILTTVTPVSELPLEAMERPMLPKPEPATNGKPRKPRDCTPRSTLFQALAVIDRVLTRLPDDDARRKLLRMASELVEQPTLFTGETDAEN